MTKTMQNSKNSSMVNVELQKVTQLPQITTDAQALINRLSRRRIMDSRKTLKDPLKSKVSRSPSPNISTTFYGNGSQNMPILTKLSSTKEKSKGKENIITQNNVVLGNLESPSIIDLQLINDTQTVNNRSIRKRLSQPIHSTTPPSEIRSLSKGKEVDGNYNALQKNPRQKRTMAIVATPLSNLTNSFINNDPSTSNVRPSRKRRLDHVYSNIPVFPTNDLNSIAEDRIQGISKGIYSIT
ncbi:hypothetical protein QVD17_00914 [Tagetes erecta]|uniref:Uncharacterized protein n=1 Tax=Tagetes erecta TaxID=13708 RepID=A0AAD8P7F4_TARER|nr:hypothetical protein QVD17_00914 [Tagetes erecta]